MSWPYSKFAIGNFTLSVVYQRVTETLLTALACLRFPIFSASISRVCKWFSQQQVFCNVIYFHHFHLPLFKVVHKQGMYMNYTGERISHPGCIEGFHWRIAGFTMNV